MNKQHKNLRIISIPIFIQTLLNQIVKNYELLDCKYVAVRSSATSEDGKEHTWAGTLETFLNVDRSNIIECVRKCWYSIFKPRAVFYRIKNEENSDIAVAPIIRKKKTVERFRVNYSGEKIYTSLQDS